MTREWYFQSMGQELGPLSAPELKAKVTNGQIQPDTLIRKGTEGKWLFAGNVKGLFAVAAEPPPPPAMPAPKAKSSATIPVMSGSKSDINVDRHSATGARTATAPAVPANFVSLHEELESSHAPSVEFYDFVGFRQAISPVLYDAVKQFVCDCGITMNQLNRRALANFINRPELASDLSITEVVALPQPVNEKSNRDGRFPLSDREKLEVAAFRFTLFNSSQKPIHVEEGVFLPESIEERTYDTIVQGRHPTIDHTGHLRVRLGSPVVGKSIRMNLDFTIAPTSTREILIWFYEDPKPSFVKIRGQLLVGHGNELAMSEHFTMTLHGDSPNPSQ